MLRVRNLCFITVILMTSLDYKNWCEEATASTLEPNTSYVTTETELTFDSTPSQVTFICRLATRQVWNIFKQLCSCVYDLDGYLTRMFILPITTFFFLSRWRDTCVMVTSSSSTDSRHYIKCPWWGTGSGFCPGLHFDSTSGRPDPAGSHWLTVRQQHASEILWAELLILMTLNHPLIFSL